ncbi:MAG: carboxymuconolactone decarboxylase family protein [bacterium]|nr:carboxymuconolactone decarboxylase family protein [bacterium]
MSREQVNSEIAGALGLVPSFMNNVPDERIGAEWELFKQVQGQENHLPMKYRELIGLGIAAASKCKYCVYFHTKFAKTFGASDAEIEEALSFAKSNVGWSAYINGVQPEWASFTSEIDQACAHIGAQIAAANNGQG